MKKNQLLIKVREVNQFWMWFNATLIPNVRVQSWYNDDPPYGLRGWGDILLQKFSLKIVKVFSLYKMRYSLLLKIHLQVIMLQAKNLQFFTIFMLFIIYICLKKNYIKQHKSSQFNTNTLLSWYRILWLTGFAKKYKTFSMSIEHSLVIQRWFSEMEFLGPSLVFFVF